MVKLEKVGKISETKIAKSGIKYQTMIIGEERFHIIGSEVLKLSIKMKYKVYFKWNSHKFFQKFRTKRGANKYIEYVQEHYPLVGGIKHKDIMNKKNWIIDKIEVKK